MHTVFCSVYFRSNFIKNSNSLCLAWIRKLDCAITSKSAKVSNENKMYHNKEYCPLSSTWSTYKYIPPAVSVCGEGLTLYNQQRRGANKRVRERVTMLWRAVSAGPSPAPQSRLCSVLSGWRTMFAPHLQCAALFSASSRTCLDMPLHSHWVHFWLQPSS